MDFFDALHDSWSQFDFKFYEFLMNHNAAGWKMKFFSPNLGNEDEIVKHIVFVRTLKHHIGMRKMFAIQKTIYFVSLWGIKKLDLSSEKSGISVQMKCLHQMNVDRAKDEAKSAICLKTNQWN
jgi:hypothetical protein